MAARIGRGGMSRTPEIVTGGMSRELTFGAGSGHAGDMDIEVIIERLGGVASAAECLGRKRTTVAMWRRQGGVPPKDVPAVARALGVDPAVIWPALASSAPADAA